MTVSHLPRAWERALSKKSKFKLLCFQKLLFPGNFWRMRFISPRKSNWNVLSFYRSGWMTDISRIKFRQSRTKLLTHPPFPPIQCWSTLSSGRNSLVGLLIAEPTLNRGEGARKESFWDRLGVIRCKWHDISKMDKIDPCVNTFCPGLKLSANGQ